MKQSKALTTALLACGLSLGGAAVAGSPSGSMLGNTCAGCHGTDGASSGPATPTIAGLSKEYLAESMKAYKDGSRPSTIMTRIAKGYSDEEIGAMAEFFAGKKFVRANQMADAGKAAKGEKLHEKYCEKCHEDGGSSAADDSGVMAGQWKPYLQYTFNDFMSGKREMPKKMKKKVDSMKKKEGDAGIAALIEYYGSQK